MLRCNINNKSSRDYANVLTVDAALQAHYAARVKRCGRFVANAKNTSATVILSPPQRHLFELIH